jgi:hypothetical protein
MLKNRIEQRPDLLGEIRHDLAELAVEVAQEESFFT